MLFKISKSFFYMQKVAYFVQKQVILIRSNPTFLRCIADETRSNKTNLRCTADHHAVPRSTYGLWRAGSSPTILQPVEKLIPLITTSQSGRDQPPLYFKPTYALPRSLPIRPFFQSGGWSALWCERAFSDQEIVWLKFISKKWLNAMCTLIL